MHSKSLIQALFLGLLASAPITAGLPIAGSQDLEQRDGSDSTLAKFSLVSGISARHHTEAQIAAKNAAAKKKAGVKREPHHTEAQIAAKNAAAAKKKNQGREAEAEAEPQTPPPDEFGPWDTEEDEFGSWVDKREPHHTEAQIAAKNAAAKKKAGGKREPQTPPADEFGPWDAEEDEFGSWVDKREPHHTEAQIAAKNAAAKKKAGGKREPHHTEAQIAAKNAAAAKKKNQAREPEAEAEPQTPPADEFGPWDSEADEFGSWVDKREPHHTEAQIAAKNAAAKKTSKGN